MTFTIEVRQKEISELQKYIGQYSKTRDVYAAYKASGWSRDFYEKNAADIILNRAAKKHFDSLGTKKLPSIKQLKEEYAKLTTEKKKLYSEYHPARKFMHDVLNARQNVQDLLNYRDTEKVRGNVRAEL